jgi:hypothetical protein
MNNTGIAWLILKWENSLTKLFISYKSFYSTPPRNLDKRTTITIGEKTFEVEADDLEKICDLGRGAYGIVEKMRHIPSGTIMAVKVIFSQHFHFISFKMPYLHMCNLKQTACEECINK